MSFTPPTDYNSATMVDKTNKFVAPNEQEILDANPQLGGAVTKTQNITASNGLTTISGQTNLGDTTVNGSFQAGNGSTFDGDITANKSISFHDNITSGITGNINIGNGVLQKGWYYNYIDTTNLGTWEDVLSGNSHCDFYIAKTQTLTPVSTTPTIDTTIISGWEIGDIISLVDNDHAINRATITNIDYNKITIALIAEGSSNAIWSVLNGNAGGWKPLNGSLATNNDYSLYVIAKPTIGNSIIVGESINLGNNEFSSNTSIVAGNNNKASSDNSLVVGKGLISSALYGSVVGKFNVDVGRSGGVFVVGVGASDADRKNGLVVNTNGTVLNGKMTSDTAEITGAVSVGSLSSSGLVSGLDGGFADSLSTTSLNASTGHFDLSVEINGTDVMSEINSKQDTLTAGTNISISGNTISSKDTTYSPATTSANGLMSSTDKTKLDGIAAGAQVNTVTSVAGKTGAVTLSKSDVGLSNVDNTSDANKPISTATQTALNLKQNKLATYSEDLALSSGSITAKSSTGNQDSKVLEFNTSSSDYPYCNMDIGKGNYTSNVNIGNNTYQTFVTVADNSSTADIKIKPSENILFILGAATHDILKVNKLSGSDISEITLNGELKGTAIDTSVDYTNISSNSTTRVPNTNAVATSLGSVVTTTQTALNLKQNTLTAGTNITISPTSEISATSGSITSGATTLVTGGTVYNYIPRIASTSNVAVTPMAIQTATTIVSDTVSGYITVIPTSTNVGAVYIIDGSTYSNANPIYPDPAFVTRYQYANLSTVKLFVDTIGDSAVCVVEKNNI